MSIYDTAAGLANRGQWKQAHHELKGSPELLTNAAQRDLMSETLVQLGRDSEAVELLRGGASLGPAEQWRLRWLSKESTVPGRAPCGEVLHALYRTAAIPTVRLLCFGGLPAPVMRQVEEFHRREFPHHRLQVASVTEQPVEESFETLRNLLDVGALPSWLSPQVLRRHCSEGELPITLVVARAEMPSAYSAGYGAPGVVLLHLQEGDRFQATITAHELYHALLDLNHSNGLEGPLDAGSVMGPFGCRTPLEHTYIAGKQREFCTTTAQVQTLVEQERWNEALELDSDYLGLYSRACARSLTGERPEEALRYLQRWFERDPGPEAGAALSEISLNLGHDPTPHFKNCRGYGEAANTHLYLAQACLEAYRFDLAVGELEKAHALEPNNIHVPGMLGWAHHALGRGKLAVQLYQEALSACPGWDSVEGRLRWLKGERYRAPNADPELLWLQSQTEPPELACQTLEGLNTRKAIYRRGWLLAHQGRPEEARSILSGCLNHNRYDLPGKGCQAWLEHLNGSAKASQLAQEVLGVWSREPGCLALLRSI